MIRRFLIAWQWLEESWVGDLIAAIGLFIILYLSLFMEFLT